MIVAVFQKCILSAFKSRFNPKNIVTAVTAILAIFVFFIFSKKSLISKKVAFAFAFQAFYYVLYADKKFF